MNAIKEYYNKRKEKFRNELETSIRDSFDIEERNGKMWLTHRGTAIRLIAPDAQTTDITAMLNEARDCAVEFERLSIR